MNDQELAEFRALYERSAKLAETARQAEEREVALRGALRELIGRCWRRVLEHPGTLAASWAYLYAIELQHIVEK